MEAHFKHFRHSAVNSVLQNVALECNRGEAASTYIEFDKSRYVRVNSIIRCLFKNCFLQSDKLGDLLSIRILSGLMLLTKLLVRSKVTFESDADVIHIRNHISVFFLDSDVRVKCFAPGGVRTKDDLLNEWSIRSNIQLRDSKIRVPRLIRLINTCDITCYIDEVVLGKAVSWEDDSSEQVLDLLLDTMFSYYIENGISWKRFNEIHPLASKEILDLRGSDGSPSPELVSKKIVCSSVHGDLSLGNVIAADDAIYVIDWELSRFGSVISDLYKVLEKKPIFTRKIEDFFVAQRAKIDRDRLINVATFAEHLALESFARNT